MLRQARQQIARQQVQAEEAATLAVAGHVWGQGARAQVGGFKVLNPSCAQAACLFARVGPGRTRAGGGFLGSKPLMRPGCLSFFRAVVRLRPRMHDCMWLPKPQMSL